MSDNKINFHKPFVLPRDSIGGNAILKAAIHSYGHINFGESIENLRQLCGLSIDEIISLCGLLKYNQIQNNYWEVDLVNLFNFDVQFIESKYYKLIVSSVLK